MKNKITVFSLSSSKKLAQDIASILGTKVGDCKVHHFADGEILCEIGESVRGKDVFIVQSTSNPVTENLMEILVLTDALKRASAREITAVIPYFGYARQDRKAKPRQPITSKLVADLLTTAGVNRVVTVDLHAAQIQGFFDIPVDEMLKSGDVVEKIDNNKTSFKKDRNYSIVFLTIGILGLISIPFEMSADDHNCTSHFGVDAFCLALHGADLHIRSGAWSTKHGNCSAWRGCADYLFPAEWCDFAGYGIFD